MKYVKTKSFSIACDKDFKIINFADVHLVDAGSVIKNETIYKTIDYAIKTEAPDIITLSGDNAWCENVVEYYKALCDFLDSYKTPYFVVFGNHDREHASAEALAQVINSSEYGYIEKGGDDGSYGNYVVDICKGNSPVHRIFMMDSRDYNKCTNYKYVENPVAGMHYYEVEGKKVYGTYVYDGIRDGQLNWYKSECELSGAESTVITHMPILEYIYAYEEYKSALNNGDLDTVNKFEPIGECRQLEYICSSCRDFGFFDLIKSIGKTKNIICGHDHNNDFSILYNGVRLTFAVKTGDSCYWHGSDMNGYTKITVGADGKTALEQCYYNLT